MKVLNSHHGMKGKNGWGRTFYMAQGLADLGHDVTLLTINPKCSFFKINTIIYQGVKIKVLPDFFPAKMKSSGFAIWSTLFGLIYSMFHKFEICIADCGHRFTSLPCKINRFIYHSVYISEWWDFFGKGGYIKKKSRLFRLTYGRLECYNELNDKRKADAIVVLSTFMKDRAVENGIDSEKIFIVPGGSIVKDVKPLYPSYSSVEKRKINIAYIGINNHEIDLIAPFIEALKCENVKNSYRLILYGNTISNEKWNQLGLSEIAEYRGWLDYSKDVSTLKDIDVFLQLLDDNNVSKAGWPNKLGDYLAFGKPVILSPYGDIIDFVKYEKDGVENPVTLNSNNNWKYTWEKLPKNINGKVAEYTVEETLVPSGYTVNTTTEGDVIVLTNNHTVTEVVAKSKQWENVANANLYRVDMELYKKGETIKIGDTKSVIGNDMASWRNCEKYDKNGNLIEYVVKETKAFFKAEKHKM